MTRIYSPQQTAVFDWVKNGHGSAFVEAVAGAGKTTTLIEALKLTSGSVAFAAFNTKISDEIKAKTRDLSFGNRLRVGTFHSFGYGAWRRIHPAVKLDANKKSRDVFAELRVADNMQGFVGKLIGLAKQRAIGLFGAIDDDSLWYDMVDHFDLAYEIEDPEQIAAGIKLAQQGLKLHNSLASSLIDFDDMIYQPLISGCRMWENDWLLVDEAQDTNPARRALARKMLRRAGRAIFVGDRHQAIYGFTGADSDAIDCITQEFHCTSLPLTITFRCPKAVVQMARSVVDHIEAHETAPEGEVTQMEDVQMFEMAKTMHATDDAILCRNTKPLVSVAYSFIRKGIACHVEGKDIGIGLLKLANRWQVRSLDQLRDRLEAFVAKETEKLIAKGKETQAESLSDRVETLLIIMDECQTIDELRSKITAMFVDGDKETKPTLTLSTIHKSKGREWPRVFIYGYNELLPSKYARQQWQRQQEANLQYVAVTRSMSKLAIVSMSI